MYPDFLKTRILYIIYKIIWITEILNFIIFNIKGSILYIFN